MSPRSNHLARRFAAALEDLRAHRECNPDEAEAIRCAVACELVALTNGDRVPLSVKADEV